MKELNMDAKTFDEEIKFLEENYKEAKKEEEEEEKEKEIESLEKQLKLLQDEKVQNDKRIKETKEALSSARGESEDEQEEGGQSVEDAEAVVESEGADNQEDGKSDDDKPNDKKTDDTSPPSNDNSGDAYLYKFDFKKTLKIAGNGILDLLTMSVFAQSGGQCDSSGCHSCQGLEPAIRETVGTSAGTHMLCGKQVHGQGQNTSYLKIDRIQKMIDNRLINHKGMYSIFKLPHF